MRDALSLYLDHVSADFAFSAIVWLIFVGVPVLAHINYPGVFGDSAELKLFAFATLGTAASFALFAGECERLLAVVPGLLAGAVGITLYLYLPALHALIPLSSWPWFPYRHGPFFVLALGALPGMLLLALLRRLRRSSRE